MRSPGMISIELSRREALSNSRRSRGMAHTSAVSAPTTHHRVTTTARGKVTVLGNTVSLERWCDALGPTRPIMAHFTNSLRWRTRWRSCHLHAARHRECVLVTHFSPGLGEAIAMQHCCEPAY